MSSIKSRTTTYNGIRMRSRLEADYAADLDRLGYRWEYEPECFASEAGQWLPDFGCTFSASGPLIIFDEVKPAGPLIKLYEERGDFHGHVDAVLRRIVVAHASRPDALLRLMFWQYGQDKPYLSVCSRRRGDLWWAEFGVQPFWLLWPGMGQSAGLRARAS